MPPFRRRCLCVFTLSDLVLRLGGVERLLAKPGVLPGKPVDTGGVAQRVCAAATIKRPKAGTLPSLPTPRLLRQQTVALQAGPQTPLRLVGLVQLLCRAHLNAIKIGRTARKAGPSWMAHHACEPHRILGGAVPMHEDTVVPAEVRLRVWHRWRWWRARWRWRRRRMRG